MAHQRANAEESKVSRGRQIIILDYVITCHSVGMNVPRQYSSYLISMHWQPHMSQKYEKRCYPSLPQNIEPALLDKKFV